MKNKIACYYFPTTVVFVDDKERFLDGLAFELNENLAYRTFTDPDNALAFLKVGDIHNRKSHYLLNPQERIAEEFFGECGHTIVDIDISGIYQQIYSSDRFHEISVVAVDYAMPSKNGLELAKQIKQNNKNIKILMVTGEATDELAIEAFNKGIIDRFIKKSSPDFTKILNKFIVKLQEQYFNDLSASIIDDLATNQDCCLDDSAFIEFFNKLRCQRNIAEYYLIDEFGSFLLVDIAGKLSFLVIKSDNMINDYYNIAKDNYASSQIINDLANRKKLPFFFTKADIEQPVEQWNAYLYPAKKLIGQKNIYHYALIEGKSISDINQDKILSYQNYLNNLDV